MLHMAILRSPLAHAKINVASTRRGPSALPGVVAVVTGELMAQHNLAWMPTLSYDTQAVLATDKVRFQGQEVAAVIAEDPYIAKDALELIDVDYEPLAGGHHAAAGAGARTRRSSATTRKARPTTTSTTGRRATRRPPTRRSPRADKVVSLDTFYPRCHPAPLETCGVRGRRGHRHRPGDDLHDVAGAARHPHGVRAGDRACPRRTSASSRPTSAAGSATRCRSTPGTWWRRPPRCCSATR